MNYYFISRSHCGSAVCTLYGGGPTKLKITGSKTMPWNNPKVMTRLKI